MTDRTIAYRYAQALFDAAGERDAIVQFADQWQLVVDTLLADAGTQEVFFGRFVAANEKKNLVKKAFAGKIDQPVLNFLCLIIDKSREEYLAAIYDEYRLLQDEKDRVLNVGLASAVAVEAEQEAALAKAINAATAKTARFNKSVDPALIGGMVMTIGDVVYDGSVLGQLKELQQQLAR